MAEYLKKIFEKFFCTHKWKVMEKTEVYTTNFYGTRDEAPYEIRILYSC